MGRAAPPITLSRPLLIDYLLLLGGAALSLFLFQINPLRASPSPGSTSLLPALFAILPDAMRLSEGIILVWPLFLLTQSVSGRSQSLTAAEWLGVLAWVGIASLTALAGCRQGGLLPSRFEEHAALPLKYWYLVLNPTMAGLGVILALAGLLRRAEPPPWTHSLVLALLMWPVLSLAAILALGKFA